MTSRRDHIGRRLARRGLVRLARGGTAVTIAILAGTLLHTPSAGAATAGPTLAVTVNGQSAATSSDARPAQILPNQLTQVTIKVTNRQGSTVRVTSVRLEGDVLGLPLFSYDSAVDLVVPTGATRSLRFPVSVNGIGSQATGLVVVTVTLLGPSGGALASQSLVTKVHGSIKSIYGLFGLVVLALTASSLLFSLLALARHTLPQNRWLRGVRFFVPGFGIGLVLNFTLAAFGVFVPGPGHWISLMIFTSLTGFLLGYLTPAPIEEEFDDYDDDVLLAQIVVVDDDPLDAEDQVLASVGAPDSRPTGAPDSRPTGAPDSRPTGAPDSRPTGAPDSRPTGAPDSRPTTGP
jgi:hypothetical protein